MKNLIGACLLFAISAAVPLATYAQTSRYDELANLPFEENRPTTETAKTLNDELLFERATQTYLWALPLINTLGMKNGSEKVFGAGYNVLPIWKKRLDAKTLVTTPNSDVIYAMSYVDLGKDGPLVFEAPPGLQGILLDFWQRPIPVDGGKFFGDVGLPGPDAGKGGKFLLLPPGYKRTVPSGYYVYRSATNNVFVFLRAFYLITALTWALEIGDVQRFSSIKKAISYCGLCGAEKSSANTVQRTPLSKQRNKHLQTTLIEAAKLAPRFSPELAMVYDQEKQKGNANRATLAVARKLVAYLMAIDRGQRSFEVGKVSHCAAAA